MIFGHDFNQIVKEGNISNSIRHITFNNNYNELLEQQKEINALLNQYQSVNAEYKDSSLLVNQESFIYRFFYVLVVLIIFIGIIILFNLGSGGFNIVLILLITSFIFYLFRMLTIAAVIAFITVLYLLLR